MQELRVCAEGEKREEHSVPIGSAYPPSNPANHSQVSCHVAPV